MNSWISTAGLATRGDLQMQQFCPEYKTHKAQIHSKQNRRRKKKKQEYAENSFLKLIKH